MPPGLRPERATPSAVPVILRRGNDIAAALLLAGYAHDQTIRTNAVHLFIDVLANVGHVKNAASIIESPIHEVFPKGFEDGERDLSFLRGHEV